MDAAGVEAQGECVTLKTMIAASDSDIHFCSVEEFWEEAEAPVSRRVILQGIPSRSTFLLSMSETVASHFWCSSKMS